VIRCMHNTAQSSCIEPVVEGRENRSLALRIDGLDAEGETEGKYCGTMGLLFVPFLSSIGYYTS
jgi:hypothetical protein